MAKRRIAPVQPLVRASDRDGHHTVAEQQVDWSRRGQLASFAMTIALWSMSLTIRMTALK